MSSKQRHNDPTAPKANTLIPASNLLVVDGDGAILLQRRRDTGQWALPGGAQDIGETAAQCAVRECLEETGIVAYTDGEIRQRYENISIGRPVSGEPTWFATNRTSRSSAPCSSRRNRAPSSGWKPVVARRGA